MTEGYEAFLHVGAHDTVLKVMQSYMLAGEDGIPSALVVDANGEGYPLAAMFIQPGDKDAFAARIKAEVRAREAICAAFAAESWLTVDAVSPAESPGRLEVIVVHSESRDGTILDSFIEIVRDASGKVTGFEKLAKERRQRGDHPAAQGEDRFSGFFQADA